MGARLFDDHAVIIGYIALFAVAIQTGIIMIIFIRQALARKRPERPTWRRSGRIGAAAAAEIDDGCGDRAVA
jgi:energy-converting hydrogenase Eha subunit A